MKVTTASCFCGEKHNFNDVTYVAHNLYPEKEKRANAAVFAPFGTVLGTSLENIEYTHKHTPEKEKFGSSWPTANDVGIDILSL